MDDTIGDRIALMLEERGISGSELERRTGMSKGYASRLIGNKRGQRISPDLLQRIADAIECSYQWLATGEGSRHQAGTVSKRVRYVNLEAAIKQLGPALSPVVAEEVRARFRSPADLDVSTWVALLLDRQRSRGVLLAAEDTVPYGKHDPPDPER